jgi:CubicO group peptidase (beta-lactamase class C family)
MTPLLTKWRASRGEEPWSGPTIEEKTTLPLMFEPGSSWVYGGSLDWAGKVIERITGVTLEVYMSKYIWQPLNITDITFWPHDREDMTDRMATISLLGEDGKAVDIPDFDMNYGTKECIGGGGAFATPRAYFALLQAVLREDTRILKPDSYVELFKPQLDDPCKKALNELIIKDPEQRQYLSVNVPPFAKKNWCFAGMISEEEQPGWMSKNTILWGGLPCIVWVSCLSPPLLVGFH